MCFFQDAKEKDSCNIIFGYRMHDMIHDLAKMIAMDLKLQTFQSFSSKLINTELLDKDVFRKINSCGVLNLWNSDIYEVLSSIDNLKLLRYANFSKTNIKQLLESICNLLN